MPTLSSIIVKREIASVRDVEEALARQALYGGDLVTSLLELARVSEAELILALSESLALPPAPAGELPSTDERVRRLVPGDIARRYSLYPLQESEGKLLIAVSEPLPAEVANDLEFSLGLTLEQCAATLVRIQEAVCRDYALELDRRIARVLARLNGSPDPHPTGAPPAASSLASNAPAAPPQPPLSSRPAEPEAPMSTEPPLSSAHASGPNRSSIPAARVDVAALARAETRSQRRRRRLGPYTMAMAEADLRGAGTRDDVMRAFFDFASQYFEYSVLLTVHGDLAEGRDAHGAGAARSKVLALGIPLDLPSTLSAVVAHEPYRIARLSSAGLDGALAKDLERRPGRAVLLLPVRVRERPVLVLYGDHGANDVELGAVGDVISIAPLVATALERLILRRKGVRQAAGLPAPVGDRAPKQKPLPSVRERANVLATALSRESSAPAQGDDAASPASGSDAALARPVISVGLKTLTASEVGVVPRLAAPSPQLLEELEATELSPEAPLHGLRGPATVRGLGSVPPPKPERRSSTPIRMPPPPPATAYDPVPARAETSDSPRKLELLTQSEPAPPELIIEDATVDAGVEELLADSEPMLIIPRSRSVAHSARPLPPPGFSAELRLPTVIVDLANDTEELVERAAAGDAKAAERLVEIGAAAVPALVGAFPGPILSELRRGVGDGPPKASECGPLLKILARIGPKAAGVLGVRTNDGQPQVRAWATRLLGEMPCLDAARAIARRFIDEDAEVRRAALAAGRMLQAHATAGATLAASLSEMLLDSSRRDALTHMIVEAIADLREARTIPALAALLASGSTEVQRSAHWALVVLARNDLGDSASTWDDWWRVNAGRHRIEWLIDALMNESPDIRRAAGDELKSVTKEYFGYYDDLPARERERAQQRYRDWWEAKGKARFTAPR